MITPAIVTEALRDYLKQIGAALAAGNATEHTHRPALKTLIERLNPHVTATNEPKRIACGAPDFIVSHRQTPILLGIPIGYIEAKDVGVSLDGASASDQLRRYRSSLANLILTDYLEFRWYVAGEPRLTARLAQPDGKGRLYFAKDAAEEVFQLLESFLQCQVPVLAGPRELAMRMAHLARLIREIIIRTFTEEAETGGLHDQLTAFRKVLVADMTPEQFADMYAQTLAYGLFAARCNHLAPPFPGSGAGEGARFTRGHAAWSLPKTNPFLRKMFNHIAGPDLDERISWAVDDLAELLARADIAAVLKDFGRATRQEDPVVHFYETFLSHYDPALREARGVYYTPEPVVAYIVRGVDQVLKDTFKLAQGLADGAMIEIDNPQVGKSVRTGKGKAPQPSKYLLVHKVQVLDPAAGTGTFLFAVIRLIHTAFAGNEGLWPGYVARHLLPRLYGFELLMAPYAVAHMKLSLQLRESGYSFQSDERLRVYLTNTLEEAHEMTGLPLFTQWLAEEATAAGGIKRDTPIMVVLGNPPYSGHSANTGAWIAGLLRGFDQAKPGGNRKTASYFEVDGQPLGEKNPKWLNDDYVKFIRFAQWRIEQTGYGILAFVTNHGYLDNPTFRGMRRALMQAFDDIYVLDLHGNSKKKECAPDGGKDENVFDIQQGVAIGIFIKRQGGRKGEGKVHHAELWGERQGKYRWLWDNDLVGTAWRLLKPKAPFYRFTPQDEGLWEEYERGWKITEMMPVSVLGFQSHRDRFAIAFDQQTLHERISALRDRTRGDDKLRTVYDLTDNRDWQLSRARQQARDDPAWERLLVRVAYRPFDWRWCYYSTVAMDYPRRELQDHVVGRSNLCLNLVRQTRAVTWRHAIVSDTPTPAVFVEVKDGSSIFPLYLYPAGKADLFDENTPSSTATERHPNLAPTFITDLSARLSLTFVPEGQGDLVTTFGPEDVFHYAYAVFHSPTFRARYGAFLKTDFPRLPLTSDTALFRRLCEIGKQLVKLHLMEELPSSCRAFPPQPAPGERGGSGMRSPKEEERLEVSYPIAGNNQVEAVRYAPPSNKAEGRIYLNKTQYFAGVPETIWELHIGGYQVCEKWLKDRKGRTLTYDDLTHYQRIVSVAFETRRLQEAIDQAIDRWPIV